MFAGVGAVGVAPVSENEGTEGAVVEDGTEEDDPNLKLNDHQRSYVDDTGGGSSPAEAGHDYRMSLI